MIPLLEEEMEEKERRRGPRARPAGERAPEISVLMTVYNTVAYLDDAVESVLHQQTQRSWELVIVDDGSADGSLAAAQRLAARHPKHIRVLQHRRAANLGISASRNVALAHARAPLVAFLDSDDIWLPHHLDTLADLLLRMPAVAMVYAGAERWVDFTAPFEEASSRAATWGRNYLPPLVPEGERTGMLPPGRLLEWFAVDESFVPCICSVMVRTEAARQVNGFCNAFRGLYDDQAFHARLSLHFPVYAVDVCVARYRQHAASCCARGRLDETGSRVELERFHSFLSGERAESAAVNP